MKNEYIDSLPFTLFIDFKNHINRSADNFNCLIFYMIGKADPHNRERLRLSWPEHVKLWEYWYNGPENPEWLKSPKTTRLPKSTCPICQHELDATSTLKDDQTPKENDVTICLHCGMLLKFDKKLLLQKMNDKEIEKLKENKEGWIEITEAMDIINKLHDKEKNNG